MSESVGFSLMICIILLLIAEWAQISDAAPGSWRVLQKSVGVSAMHMQLLNNDRVIIFDRTDFGASNITLPNGKCRLNEDTALQKDCTAHSVEFNSLSNTFRPLMILTDTWCSSGAVSPNGQLQQTGGWGDGGQAVRVFQPCPTCDWNELGNKLLAARWYASNHILPNGQIIVVGGQSQFNYEFYPKTDTTNGLYNLPFLQQTTDNGAENNLYPYVFLNVDGNLFIFANNRAILLDYMANKVVKTYPTIPDGGNPRSYPSTGSAVLLPLKDIDNNALQAEVLVCGGAPKGSAQQAYKGTFIQALNNCARIKITDPNPQWVMEDMPMSRTMGDMVLLPDGKVLIINGVEVGVAGWDLGRNAVLAPVIYNPDANTGARFETQAPSTTARTYHSTAILLRDGTVLAGGGNAHFGYVFGPGVLFPTELSLEAFSPAYLAAKVKPTIVVPGNLYLNTKYKQVVPLEFTITGGIADENNVKVTMIMPPFTTHSFSQGQRMLVLTQVGKVVKTATTYKVSVRMPSSPILAPSVYYMLFVVHQGVPSEGKWVKIG